MKKEFLYAAMAAAMAVSLAGCSGGSGGNDDRRSHGSFR